MTRIFQTYYNRHHRDIGTTFEPNSSLTDQDYRLQTEVDYLLSHMAGHSRTPLYGVQETMTFEDWSNEMAHLKRRYNDLSEDVRKQFSNPQEYLAWATDPNNYISELPTLKQAEFTKTMAENLKLEKSEKYREQARLLAEAIKEK